MSRVAILALASTWALCLLQLLTIVPGRPFVILEPGSWGQIGCVALFLVGSAGLPPSRLRPLVAVHLAAVAVGIVAHPLTWPFGRDGSLVVMGIHFVLVLTLCTRLRAEVKLAAWASLVALLIAETGLSAFKGGAAARPPGVLDYGDVMGAYGPGGFLKPGLDALVVGAAGRPVAFVTNAQGFRNRRPLSVPKPAGLRRVFLVGDSFVVGYRTDQDRTLGHVLESELTRRWGGAPVEVMIAGAGHPVASRELVEGSLLSMEPDAIVVGLTLGNDISQSWLAARHLPATVLEGPLLPGDAFESSEAALLPIRLDRTLGSFRLYARLSSRLRADVIKPWFDDYPCHVHVFDPGHSLGHFYSRRRLPRVEQSYRALFGAMDGLARSCAARGVPLEFVILPQRFQVDPREWRATLFRFGLDPAAFDVERPDRRILGHCESASIRCRDLLPALRPFCAERACYQPLGDMHWGAEAQARAASVLADDLVEALSPQGAAGPGEPHGLRGRGRPVERQGRDGDQSRVRHRPGNPGPQSAIMMAGTPRRAARR